MQITENNWVRRICKVTQGDRRKMKELREEICMKKKHLKMKVVGSRMRWAGHVQRMGEDRLSKRGWKAEEGGRRRKEEDESCDGKTMSNEILKGQVRTANNG